MTQPSHRTVRTGPYTAPVSSNLKLFEAILLGLACFSLNPRDNVCVCFTVACHVLSLAGNLWQRHSATPHQRTSPAETVLPGTTRVVPKEILLQLCCTSFDRLHLKHFLETSPLRNDGSFWPAIARQNGASKVRRLTSSRFSPPHGYPASQAATYSLLRDHLPPHITSTTS